MVEKVVLGVLPVATVLQGRWYLVAAVADVLPFYLVDVDVDLWFSAKEAEAADAVGFGCLVLSIDLLHFT